MQNLPLRWAAPILFLYSLLSKKTILSLNLSQSTCKEHLGPTQSLPDTVAVVLAGQVLVGRADSGEVEGGEAARELRGVLETSGRLPGKNQVGSSCPPSKTNKIFLNSEIICLTLLRKVDPRKVVTTAQKQFSYYAN